MLDKLKNAFNKTAVSAYKLLGFVVLTTIMFGISFYLLSSVFYLFDRDWVVPVILSPSSDKVLQMNSLLVRQNYQREQLQAEKLGMQAQLEQIDRTIAVQQEMLGLYQASIEAEVRARRAERDALRSLYGEYLEAKPAVEETSAAMAAMTERNIESELEAGLISEESYLRGKSLASSSMAGWVRYAQKEVELQTRIAELDREVAALDALLAEMDGAGSIGDDTALSVHALSLMGDYNKTRLEVANLEAQRRPIERQIAAIDNSTEDYDHILATIERSPYYQALDEEVTVAFVPYDNLHGMEVGDPVYGCALELLWCKQVGTVSEILDSEIQIKHPVFKTDMRGLMLEIDLDDERWGEEKALHVNSKPLFI